MEPKFRKIIFYYDPVKNGMAYMEIIAANIFDAKTEKHLIAAYMNFKAWELTKKTRILHLWSTHRNELWRKGATSGNEMKVVSIWLDCDCDAVDVYVDIQGDGVACHTGQKSCFHNRVL
jgi:phosphoribosyl-AMP cyclohydrolase